MTNVVNIVFDENQLLNSIPDTEMIRDWFEEKPDLPVTYGEDPLTLSCVSYRLWTESSWSRWIRLEDLVDKITDRDRSMAQSIRDYYISKLTFEKLCGVTFTKFRQDLADFLINDTPLKQSGQGLIYTLPYFYVEDCEKDTIIDSTQSVKIKDATDAHPFPRNFITVGAELYPIKEIFSYRKGGDSSMFWFKSKDNEPFLIELKTNNSLIKMFRSLFKQEKIKLNGQVKVCRLGNGPNKHYYYKMFDMELAQ